MILYNVLKEKLMKQGFNYLEASWDKELEVLTYKKGHIFVILKMYDNPEISPQEIIKDVVNVKGLLSKITHVNIWNTYMLVCLNTSYDSYIKLVMKVEKDTTAIRKYVLNNEEDFYRIPFLDDTRLDAKQGKVLFNENTSNKLGDIQEVVDYIKEITFNDGEKLTPKKAKSIIEKCYKRGE